LQELDLRDGAVGVVAFAPLGGLVRLMVGAAFTFTVTGLELVLTFALSTTIAVSAYVPETTFAQATL
jgi:hypothetical protein